MGATSPWSVEAERRLADAATELERERRRVSDEIDALRCFEDRVRTVDTETHSGSGGGGTTLAVAAFDDGIGGDSLAEVREAYEATVMAVPHYEEEYDDTYRESLAGEFDANIAVALTETRALDDRLKAALLAAVTESVTARRSLLAAVDEEDDSLASATDDLLRVAESVEALAKRPLDGESFGALDAYRARLDQLEATCEDTLDRRQRSVFEQRQAMWLPTDAPDVARYFYQDLDADYPVMSVIADLLEHIESVRNRVERAMTFCHT